MSEKNSSTKMCGCCRHLCPWATRVDDPSLYGCTKGKFVTIDAEGCEHWEENPGLAEFFSKMEGEEEE